MNRRAFSLAEMMVAIGVLGIGLTMVACFFPVAMSQHLESSAQHKAMQIAREAKNLVENSPLPTTLNITALPPAVIWPTGTVAWLPTNEFLPGNEPCWRYMITSPAFPNDPIFGTEARYVWYLFASERDGFRQHFVAVTRTLPGHKYQPHPGGGKLSPLPQPWLMALKPTGAQRLQIDTAASPSWGPPAGSSLTLMLPGGTPIMSTVTGNLYTVLDVSAANVVTLREPLLPDDDRTQPWPNGNAKGPIYFLWFPPATTGTASPYVAGLFF